MNAALGPLLFFVFAVVIWYVLFVFPQQRQARERRAVIESVNPGDEVVTYGGIFGVIKEVQEDWFIVTIADGVDIKTAKEAVVMRREPGAEPAGETK
jgi:preprotein translocase subunit YajC